MGAVFQVAGQLLTARSMVTIPAAAAAVLPVGGQLPIALSVTTGPAAARTTSLEREVVYTVEERSATISGNSVFGSALKGAGLGGGIYAVGTVTISNSTFNHNYILFYGNGGGICNGGTLEIGNTILNTAGGYGQNIFNNSGTITSAGYNLSNDDGGGYLTGPGDLINTDPLLGPLQDNGGPTFTHELLAGSPAIDAGDPSFAPPPWYDQCGPDFYRLRNDRIDIGSFEVQEGPAVTPTPTPTPTPRPTVTPRSRPTPAPRPTPPL
jgi:hypothetical protein